MRVIGESEGDLADRLIKTGLDQVRDGTLTAQAYYSGFDDLWEPFTYGVGPAGSYLATCSPTQQASIRDAFRALVGAGELVLPARAWYATGQVP